MEVFVSAPSFRLSMLTFPDCSVVRDVLNRFVEQQGVSSGDFYVIRNGQLSDLDNPLQHGAIYHLEPRLCGGKGGFGSMLRALGAQIEKTTNREACRDLSGRRLRDVNHEKEMAEWLKKQAEREAEKEQRRLERLQRKLSEPKHKFTDLEYQRQCHDLSERLEDSVIRGLQASSGSKVRADDALATKRPSSGQSEQLHKKKKKKMAAACFWTGVDELLSSEDEDEDDDESPSTSSSRGAAAVTTITQTEEEEEPVQSNSSSPASECSSSLAPLTAKPEEEDLRSADERRSQAEEGLISAEEGQGPAEEGQGPAEEGQGPAEEGQRPVEASNDHPVRPTEDPEPSRDHRVRPTEDPEASRDHPVRPTEDPEASRDHPVRPTEDPEPSRDHPVRPTEDPEPSRDHPVRPTEDPEAFKTSESSSSSQQQQEGRSLLDLSSLSSIDQLESLGLDVLKQELMSRGLKCGGTLTERATRLFSIRGLTPDQIDPVLLAKPRKTTRK